MWILMVLIASISTGEILSACNNCKPGYCNPDGKCSNCNDGYLVFLTTGGCLECVQNCETCVDPYLCDKCKVGYYGATCSRSCSEECKNRHCYKTDGQCKEGCIKGYYGGYCRSKCSEGCSNQTCVQDYGRCTDGCIKGYYDFDSYCLKCSEGCSNQTCVQGDGRCTDGCIKGYYDFDSYCLKCSEGCSNQPCVVDDGRCTDGCIDGYYGPKCYRCPGNCATCLTKYPCTTCKTGFFDKYCDKPCLNCRNNTCSFETGTCDNGCLDGYYYKKDIGCQACQSNCSKCTHGSVCEQCKPGFYVSNGRHSYENGSCLSCQKCKDPTTCFSTNVCPNCLDGSWGQYCQLRCSRNCLEVLNTSFNCWQRNFTCKEGCTEGFTGADCTEDASPGEKQPGYDVLLHAVIPALCLLVVIVLAIVGGCAATKWRNRSASGGSFVEATQNESTLQPEYVNHNSQTQTVRNIRAPPETNETSSATARESVRIYASIDEAETDPDQDNLTRAPLERTMDDLPRHGLPSSIATRADEYESLQRGVQPRSLYSQFDTALATIQSPRGSDNAAIALQDSVQAATGSGMAPLSDQEDSYYNLPSGECQSLCAKRETSATYLSLQ